VSVWWKDNKAIRKGAGLKFENGFNDNLVRMVANGINSLLWIDSWLDGGPLCARFKILFKLAECTKNTSK
jgi:hypothetical protein